MRDPKFSLLTGAVCVLALGIGDSADAAERDAPRAYQITEEREPCSDFDPLRRPHFGDTHVHTTWSFDANSQDTRNRPEDAYRFAKGEKLGIQPYDDEDQPTRHIQIDRPLDFTAVTDHSEFMGEMRMCNTSGETGYWHPVCIAHRWWPQLSFGTFAAYGMAGKKRWGFCGENNEACFAAAADTWQDIQSAAEEAYDRSSDCSFSSFVGYEWTASVGSGQNLHHNVIFRNQLVPDRALSWIETPSQVDLWDYLEEECVEQRPGCDAIAIPHNSNVSNGLMWTTTRSDGSPITAHDVKWSFDRAVSVGGFPTVQMKAGSLERPEQFEVVGHTQRLPQLDLGQARIQDNTDTTDNLFTFFSDNNYTAILINSIDIIF